MLAAVDYQLGPSMEIAVTGGNEPFVSAFRQHYLPRAVIAAGQTETIALLRGRPPVNGKPTAFVCENLVCKRPVTDVAEFEGQIACPTPCAPDET